MFCSWSILSRDNLSYLQIIVVAGVSTVEFEDNISHILGSIKLSSLSIQSVIKTCFRTIVKPFLYNNIDYGLLRLPDLDYWLTAGVTSQQGMDIPSRHLTPPLVFPWISVRHALIFFSTTGLIAVRFLCLFIHDFV